MNIFDQPDPRMLEGAGDLRSAAENYAASLGMAPGSPGWGAAIRDFVMSQPPDSPAGMPAPMQGGMPGPDGPAPGLGLAGLPAGPAFAAAASPLPGQPAPGQPGGPAGMAAPGMGLPPVPAAAQAPAGPRESLFRAASAGPSSGSIGDGPAGFGPGSDPLAARFAGEEDEPLELAQLNEGGPVFRRGFGSSRPARRPAPPPQPQQRSSYPSGRLSAEFESGRGGGPGTISNTRGDPGGVSYGTYQISTNAGTMQGFLRGPEARRWARELQGQTPGTDEFNRRWRAIAAREPEAFDQAQHAFIGRTHYDRAVENIRNQRGVDLDAMGPTVREAVWSTGVQHYGAAIPLGNAVQAADRRLRDANNQVDRTGPAYQRALIEEIYDARAAYVGRQLRNARDPARRRVLQNVLDRYPRERARALQMFDAESRQR